MAGMPEQRVQLCGCSAGADYGRNRCTKLLQQTELNVVRGCVWECSTPSRQEFGKVLISIWRKVKRKALLMKFLARNYGGIVPKKIGDREGGRHECRIMTPFHFHWCPFIKEYALLLTNCTPCPQQLPASLPHGIGYTA
jgi:hypothetical protein